MKKVMVVTGASRGIGASIARHAGKAGYSVAVHYREKSDKADQVAAAIEADGAEGPFGCSFFCFHKI